MPPKNKSVIRRLRVPADIDTILNACDAADLPPETAHQYVHLYLITDLSNTLQKIAMAKEARARRQVCIVSVRQRANLQRANLRNLARVSPAEGMRKESAWQVALFWIFVLLSVTGLFTVLLPWSDGRR